MKSNASGPARLSLMGWCLGTLEETVRFQARGRPEGGAKKRLSWRIAAVSDCVVLNLKLSYMATVLARTTGCSAAGQQIALGISRAAAVAEALYRQRELFTNRTMVLLRLGKTGTDYIGMVRIQPGACPFICEQLGLAQLECCANSPHRDGRPAILQ